MGTVAVTGIPRRWRMAPIAKPLARVATDPDSTTASRASIVHDRIIPIRYRHATTKVRGKVVSPRSRTGRATGGLGGVACGGRIDVSGLESNLNAHDSQPAVAMTQHDVPFSMPADGGELPLFRFYAEQHRATAPSRRRPITVVIETYRSKPRHGGSLARRLTPTIAYAPQPGDWPRPVCGRRRERITLDVSERAQTLPVSRQDRCRPCPSRCPPRRPGTLHLRL
jgi:hypothetical protein